GAESVPLVAPRLDRLPAEDEQRDDPDQYQEPLDDEQRREGVAPERQRETFARAATRAQRTSSRHDRDDREQRGDPDRNGDEATPAHGIKSLSPYATNAVTVESLRLRLLLVAPLRLVLSGIWLVAAWVAGAAAGPALLAFAGGAFAVAFLASN